MDGSARAIKNPGPSLECGGLLVLSLEGPPLFFHSPFRSYVVLTGLPSTSTCEPFLIVVATYSASRGRNTQTRCHSGFDARSSSVFFRDRCVPTSRPDVIASSGE